MKTAQYTIRAIPDKLDKRLREKARRSGKSLNTVVIESLAQAEGLTDKEYHYADLDWFIGGKTLDNTFDEAVDWLDSAPKDLP